MLGRRLIAIGLVALGLGACAGERVGPATPLAREQVPPAPAFDASATRQTVVEFLHAYAESPRAPQTLADLVAGEELVSWVRWLAVQHREFDGTIEAEADVRDVEFIGAIDAGRTRGAQVGISATVTFTFAPSRDDAFDRARILDGAVTLVRTEDGYRVLDLFRDGIEMTDGIELLRDVSQSKDGVTVTLDSVFMFAPNWQFNVIVENTTAATLVADPGATGLFVGAGEDAAAEAGAVTGSVLTVPASTRIDGILAAPLQETTADRTLVLTYLAGERTLTFTFPLVDLIDVASPPGDGATGATGATA